LFFFIQVFIGRELVDEFVHVGRGHLGCGFHADIRIALAQEVEIGAAHRFVVACGCTDVRVELNRAVLRVQWKGADCKEDRREKSAKRKFHSDHASRSANASGHSGRDGTPNLLRGVVSGFECKCACG
jgi:hypothetical protein